MEENLKLGEHFGQVYATRGLKQELKFLGCGGVFNEGASQLRRVSESEREKETAVNVLDWLVRNSS